MASRRERERRRAGSTTRDAKHRAGGDWSTLLIPQGVDVWQPKAGTKRIDIIPFEVGEGNPYAEQGTWYYERTYWIHRGIGPNNESFVCPAKTSKKPCPVCEARAKMARDPETDKEVLKQMRPKERQCFLVFDHDEEEKGVQLWDFSWYNFGRLLDDYRKDADEDERHINDFDDFEAGATLRIGFREESMGSNTYLEAYKIDFKPRRNGLDAELLEHGICLDEIIKVPSYEQLKKAFYQEEDDEEEETSTPKKKVPPKRKPPDDTPTAEDAGLEEGDQVKHRKFGVCEIVRISSDGTSLTLEDSDGESHKAIGVDEVKKVTKSKAVEEPEDDEEEEEQAPKKKTTKKAPAKKAPPVEEDDEDDDVEEEEDDDPPPKPKKKSAPKKPAAKAKKSAKDDDEDDDWDSGPGWDEEEEEEKPKAKKGKATKAKDDDEDEEDEW